MTTEPVAAPAAAPAAVPAAAAKAVTAAGNSIVSAIAGDVSKDTTGFFGMLKSTFAAGLAPAARVATITFLLVGALAGCVAGKLL